MKVKITKQVVELGRKEILYFIGNLENLALEGKNEEILKELAILRQEIAKKTEI